MHQLTNRELIAAMMMQAMFHDWQAGRLYNTEEMASDAVTAADALLTELSKPLTEGLYA